MRIGQDCRIDRITTSDRNAFWTGLQDGQEYRIGAELNANASCDLRPLQGRFDLPFSLIQRYATPSGSNAISYDAIASLELATHETNIAYRLRIGQDCRMGRITTTDRKAFWALRSTLKGSHNKPNIFTEIFTACPPIPKCTSTLSSPRSIV